MTRRDNGVISEDLENVLGENSHLLDRSRKKDSVYRISDFVIPVVGASNFLFRNSERFLTGENCPRDFVYSSFMALWHMGYACALYSGISSLLE